MATTRSFNSMLNEYLAYELLKDEHNKRNYLMGKVERDNSWKGGALVVPFEGASESSYKMGGLTDVADVSEAVFVRGTVSGQKEIFGTMVFNERDLSEHNTGGGDGVSEQSFLKNLPKRLSGFMDGMKEIVSTALLSGSHLCALTANGDNTGVVSVDRIERLSIGKKVMIKDGNSSAVAGYISAIDMNASTATLKTDRTYATPLDCTAFTTAQGAKLYIDGGDTASNNFTDLVDQLLPASAGGSANLFGQSKLAYPYLQAIAIDGSSVSSTNVLDSIFDAWATVIQKGRGTTDKTVLLSYKHLGNVMKKLETGSGAYRHVETKVSAYGYTEITVAGARGVLTLAGVQEMRNDVIIFVDWSGIKFHTNGDFHVIKDPEGKMYYVQRSTSGYKYFVDVALRGELVVSAPWKMGIIHSIP